MLAGTCQLRQGWLHTSGDVLAFSPPSPLHTQDEHQRHLAAWSAIVLDPSTCNSTSNRVRSIRRCRCTRDSLGWSPSPPHRLSYLRGGSAVSEPNQSDDGPSMQIDPVVKDVADAAAAVDPSISSSVSGVRGATSFDEEHPQGVAFDPDDQKKPSTRTSLGVALVTERSTATGGRKGLVSYSLLADGTLQVGKPREQRETRATARQVSDAPEDSPSVPSTTNEKFSTPEGPHGVLQAMYRSAASIRCRANEVRLSFSEVSSSTT